MDKKRTAEWQESARPDPAVALDAITLQALDMASELRAAFERLESAFVEGRDHESEQFRKAIASLAVELRDREAALEYLAREVRKRDQMISTQHATIAELQTRVEETAVHARNMEARAHHAEEHGRVRADELETVVRETATHVRNLEAMLADAEARAAAAEQAYDAWISSRGGRALTRYANTKRALLGRKD